MPRDCAISLDNLRTVPKALLVEPITELGADKMTEVCRALELASGCR
jgi:mRNA-degrading endonuclease toxin of MazEF toxin-antitoxin module